MPINFVYLSKVLEKHISDSFKQFLDLHMIISTNQSGFRNKHSCESVLIKLTDILVFSHQLIDAVTLDLHRAFDLVSHKVLLVKLKLHKCSDSCMVYLIFAKQVSVCRV